MAKEFSRNQRLADQIQKELAQLIQFQIKDPRLGMVTLNDVSVSKDLGYADVYFTVLKGSLDEDVSKEDLVKEQKEAESVLNSAAGFLRSELGRTIRLRSLPQLRFHYDVSVSRGQELSALIDRARRSDPDHQDHDADTED